MKKNETTKDVGKAIVIAALAWVIIGITLMMTPNATAEDPLSFARGSNGTALIVFGAVGIVLGLILAYPANQPVIGWIVFGFGMVGMVLGAGGLTTSPDDGDGPPPPPPEYSANWDCNWLGTTSTAHDASSEFPDSPFVAADGGSPDLDSTIGTPVTNLDIKEVLWEISVDNELLHVNGVGTNANGWLSEDAWAADVQCILTNQPQSIGGGLQAYPLWGQIEITRMYGATLNSTTFPVVYCDTTAGWYLGFGKTADAGGSASAHTTDHSYISYLSSKTCSGSSTAGEWKPLGVTATTGGGEVYFPVWVVLDAGLSSYEDADQTVQIRVTVGDNPNEGTYAGNTQSLVITIQATHD